MAPLGYTAKFDQFLSLDCARVEGRGRDQILPYGNLALSTFLLLLFLFSCFNRPPPRAKEERGKKGREGCNRNNEQRPMLQRPRQL